jgi:hypothetical protein
MNNKHKLWLIAALIGCAIIALTITACPDPDTDEKHTCSFGSWTITTPATCIAPAIETGKCSCGKKQTRNEPDGELNPDAHDWDWVVTTPATMETEGIETKTCSDCYKTDGTRPFSKLPPASTLDELEAYINSQSGGNNKDNPILISINIDLGNMTEVESGWQKILKIIDEAGKFITLDLSLCETEDAQFNPDPTIATGKDKIVQLFLPNNATEIAEGDFFYSAFDNFINLEKISGINITNIGDFVFIELSSLTEVNFPVATNIGFYAFYGCINLTQISISATANVTAQTFLRCNSLTSFILVGDGDLSVIENGRALVRNNNELVAYPSAAGSITLNGIASIGNSVFSVNTNITSVNLPTVTTIDNLAFNGCTNLTEVTLYEGLKSIGSQGFMGTKITIINLPSGLESIGNSAFRECASLTEINLPSSLINIGQSLFYLCANLTTVNMEEGIKIIPIGIFQGCVKLSEISLPSTIESIGSQAFMNCTSIPSVTIPASVTSVGTFAFGYWTATQTINFEGFSSRADADAAWGIGDGYNNWRSSCGATMIFLGE